MHPGLNARINLRRLWSSGARSLALLACSALTFLTFLLVLSSNPKSNYFRAIAKHGKCEHPRLGSLDRGLWKTLLFGWYRNPKSVLAVVSALAGAALVTLISSLLALCENQTQKRLARRCPHVPRPKQRISNSLKATGVMLCRWIRASVLGLLLLELYILASEGISLHCNDLPNQVSLARQTACRTYLKQCGSQRHMLSHVYCILPAVYQSFEPWDCSHTHDIAHLAAFGRCDKYMHTSLCETRCPICSNQAASPKKRSTLRITNMASKPAKVKQKGPLDPDETLTALLESHDPVLLASEYVKDMLGPINIRVTCPDGTETVRAGSFSPTSTVVRTDCTVERFVDREAPPALNKSVQRLVEALYTAQDVPLVSIMPGGPMRDALVFRINTTRITQTRFALSEVMLQHTLGGAGYREVIQSYLSLFFVLQLWSTPLSYFCVRRWKDWFTHVSGK